MITNMKVNVRFANLSGKFHIVKRCGFSCETEALKAIRDYAEPHGYTDIKIVQDEDDTRVTATTPGGRVGRNIAFIDYEDASNLPADYEPCGMCGFDHAYEQQAAHDWHIKNPE